MKADEFRNTLRIAKSVHNIVTLAILSNDPHSYESALEVLLSAYFSLLYHDHCRAMKSIVNALALLEKSAYREGYQDVARRISYVIHFASED